MPDPAPDAQESPRLNITSRDVAALKAQAHDLEVTIHVGKEGVTDAVADELRNQLSRSRLVKARLLRSARAESERTEIAQDLADRAGAMLVEVRGNTAVYYKPRRGGVRRKSTP